MTGARMTGAAAVPCIVLGLESQIGLALVRELGRAGVPVIGIAHSADELGLASRHLAERIVVAERRGPALLAAIRAIGERFGSATLVTVSEANLTWLAAHRAEIAPVAALVPRPEQLALALDKARTLALARELGVPVPATWQPQSMAEAHALRPDAFPVVLKWPDPAAVMAALRAAGLPLHKAEFVLDLDALRAALARYEPVGRWPLVQRYARGQGLGQFFFMHEGRVLRSFQHRRIAEWPPEGGFSSVCDAVPLAEHRALQAQSVRLLQAMRWEGVAMVEYRFDGATGHAELMEVNGRFWGSLPLAVHAGAGFALLAHFMQGQGVMPPLGPLRDDLRCRMVATELKRLERIVLHPERIEDPMFEARPAAEVWRFGRDFFSPRSRYYLWSIDDPRPFWADLRNVVRNALRNAARRARERRR